MPRVACALLSVVLLAACSESGQPLAPSTRAPAVPRSSATTTIQNLDIPFSSLQFVPCANGGAGENVLLEGTLHLVSRFTVSANGEASATVHENLQGVSGTGQITGDKYQGTDSNTLGATLAAGTTFTQTSSFQVIGPGPDNNFTAHLTSHFTVNANGEITSDHFISSVECS